MNSGGVFLFVPSKKNCCLARAYSASYSARRGFSRAAHNFIEKIDCPRTILRLTRFILLINCYFERTKSECGVLSPQT